MFSRSSRQTSSFPSCFSRRTSLPKTRVLSESGIVDRAAVNQVFAPARANSRMMDTTLRHRINASHSQKHNADNQADIHKLHRRLLVVNEKKSGARGNDRAEALIAEV